VTTFLIARSQSYSHHFQSFTHAVCLTSRSIHVHVISCHLRETKSYCRAIIISHSGGREREREKNRYLSSRVDRRFIFIHQKTTPDERKNFEKQSETKERKDSTRRRPRRRVGSSRIARRIIYICEEQNSSRTNILT